MDFKEKLCITLNKIFPLPVHPLNLQNEGIMTLIRWQYQKGVETIKYYLKRYSTKDMFKSKTILDIGCGAGGKSVYYSSLGADMVYGVDILPQYEKEASDFALKKGLDKRFKFVTADASNLPFEDGTFDTIIMNDTMEHVSDPFRVLKECNRIMKPDGKLFINFPPYYHPYGAHLSDAIGFPWVHIFFNDELLIKVYKKLVINLPDGQERIDLRISKDTNGKEYFSYINGMTLKRFNSILPKLNFRVDYYKEVPLRRIFKPLIHIPVLKEGFVKMVVAVLQKSDV